VLFTSVKRQYIKREKRQKHAIIGVLMAGNAKYATRKTEVWF